jgi:hypothetical protein
MGGPSEQREEEVRTIITTAVLLTTIAALTTSAANARTCNLSTPHGRSAFSGPCPDSYIGPDGRRRPVKVYCYDSNTGAFKHWGHCKRWTGD